MHNSTGGLPYPCSQASHISSKGHSATNEQSVKVMLCPKIRELLPPLDYMKPLCSWCCLKIATTVPFEHKRIQRAMYVSWYNLINYKTYMNQPQTCLIHLWKSMKCTMFKKSSATTGKMLDHHGASVQMWRIEKQWSSYISQMSIILGWSNLANFEAKLHPSKQLKMTNSNADQHGHWHQGFIQWGGDWNVPHPEIMKLSMVINVLSQVLNNNLVPDCIRSNLRGSKFNIFLG